MDLHNQVHNFLLVESQSLNSNQNTDDSNNSFHGPGEQNVQHIEHIISSGRPPKVDRLKFESAKNISTDPLAQELILILCKLGKLSFHIHQKELDNKTQYGSKSIIKQVRKFMSEKPNDWEDYMFITQNEPKFALDNGELYIIENEQSSSFNALMDDQFQKLPQERLKLVFRNIKHLLTSECYASLQSIAITYIDLLEQDQSIDNIRANILEQIEKDENCYLQRWAQRRKKINHIIGLIEQKDITINQHEIRRQRTKAAQKAKKLLDKQQECLQQSLMLPLLQFFINKVTEVIKREYQYRFLDIRVAHRFANTN
ncbi:hypothetical protein pb186bvf_004502 [Paramecium bursaria]